MASKKGCRLVCKFDASSMSNHLLLFG